MAFSIALSARSRNFPLEFKLKYILTEYGIFNWTMIQGERALQGTCILGG